MLRRFLDWARKRSEKQDGDQQAEPRRRFRPFRRIVDLWIRLSDMLPSWAAKYLIQGLLIFLGAPWWVWPIVVLVVWMLLGGKL
jgi:hypothetical protein